MALEYPEELWKYSKGEGESRIIQLYSFPQVGLIGKNRILCVCVCVCVCVGMCTCS